MKIQCSGTKFSHLNNFTRSRNYLRGNRILVSLSPSHSMPHSFSCILQYFSNCDLSTNTRFVPISCFWRAYFASEHAHTRTLMPFHVNKNHCCSSQCVHLLHSFSAYHTLVYTSWLSYRNRRLKNCFDLSVNAEYSYTWFTLSKRTKWSEWNEKRKRIE